MPQVDDLVIGTVIEKHSESLRLDIGTSQPARLSTMSFEGATKRNRPNIPVCVAVAVVEQIEIEVAYGQRMLSLQTPVLLFRAILSSNVPAWSSCVWTCFSGNQRYGA